MPNPLGNLSDIWGNQVEKETEGMTGKEKRDRQCRTPRKEDSCRESRLRKRKRGRIRLS